jgi:hypothetical protein
VPTHALNERHVSVDAIPDQDFVPADSEDSDADFAFADPNVATCAASGKENSAPAPSPGPLLDDLPPVGNHADARARSLRVITSAERAAHQRRTPRRRQVPR